ncbi:MAG TPA: 30S ribosomal protein S8 [Patescibacteria group bacterium]|nr:30S ribosomal protein S8 [Patescibacteria group bacterium]
MTDPIADMLTRIRNAAAVGKKDVVLPMSKMKHEVAKILERENWIQKVEILDPSDSSLLERTGKKDAGKVGNYKRLKVVLKYKKSGKPVISHLQKVSRPGLKIYVKKTEIPRVLNGLGVAIISTPRGLMTNQEAKKEGIGGEVICEVY